jgi:hypothetical protein
MSNMKSHLFVLGSALLLISTGAVEARRIVPWSYQELLDKSDVVVIATATATNDTREHIQLPGFVGQPVIGVETKFAVSAVLKGNKDMKDLVLHHYRPDGVKVPNGPLLVCFDLAKQRTYLLFLVRETDGRYAPAFGQVDPGYSGISVLEDLHTAASDPIDRLVVDLSNSQTWLDGEYPMLGLPESSSTEQILERVFQKTGFDRGHVSSYKVLEVRQVRIPGYTAALVHTDLGEKIVLFKYDGQAVGGWWSRVYEANRTYYSKRSA